jgi:2,3,4,5-tetrahydropyridine-2-carboxylate N-succinyltransferase
MGKSVSTSGLRKPFCCCSNRPNWLSPKLAHSPTSIKFRLNRTSQLAGFAPSRERRHAGQLPSARAVLMPSYVNIGAFVDADTMVDTWATVGSCAQIGKNVHLSGGVGIGGVLEPPMAHPVVIEDDAFVGSRAMITNGARVGAGAVVGSGLILNDSIPVIDAATGKQISRGTVPPWTVAVFATRAREFAGGTYGLPCALIRVPEPRRRHNKTVINDVLRSHGIAL